MYQLAKYFDSCGTVELSVIVDRSTNNRKIDIELLTNERTDKKKTESDDCCNVACHKFIGEREKKRVETVESFSIRSVSFNTFAWFRSVFFLFWSAFGIQVYQRHIHSQPIQSRKLN